MLKLAVVAFLVISCTAPSPPPESAGTTSPRPSPPLPSAAADAGIVFFFSFANGHLIRYDDSAKRLDDIGSGSIAVQAETDDVIYLAGPQGSRTLVRWDGALDNGYDCGAGGFITFNVVGACATFGSHTGPGPLPITVYPTPPLYVRRPGESQPRILLPANWGVMAAQWSPDTARLAVARVEPPYPTDETQFLQISLWIVEADGAARVLYRPTPGGGLPLSWSPDGRYLTGWSRSPGDSHHRLLLIEVASGRLTDLGTSPPQQDWVRWSATGRLAFVRGTGDETWRDKQLVVREPDGSERVVTPPGAREVVGLAPAWDPARGRLAWIAGPSGDGTGYLEGTGVGDRRVVISNLAADTTEVRCPGRVVEGVRWSRDGEVLLLLCRRPGATVGVFELWLHRISAQGASATVAVVTSLGWDQQLDRQFGLAPSLFRFVAWSRAVR